MSVYVSDFDSWEVTHDDAPGGSHTGTIDPAEIKHTTTIDGTEDHNFHLITCPVCQSVSTHPVGGGAQPPLVQQLFVTKAETDGCPCGAIVAPDTTAAPEAHVRLNCNRMDGPGRWQISGAASVVDTHGVPDPQAPKQFQVVYNTTSSLIIGMEPSGGVGPDNSVAVIHDLAEYDVLMATDPAYLSADKEHILASPPA